MTNEFSTFMDGSDCKECEILEKEIKNQKFNHAKFTSAQQLEINNLKKELEDLKKMEKWRIDDE